MENVPPILRPRRTPLPVIAESTVLSGDGIFTAGKIELGGQREKLCRVDVLVLDIDREIKGEFIHPVASGA